MFASLIPFTLLCAVNVDADVEKELTVNRVKQFKNILLCYIDFKQKEKVSSQDFFF